LSRTLEHERYGEDGGSAKDGTSALAKGVVKKKQGMRDGTAERICGQSPRGARNGAARESTQWGSQRIDGGTSQWRSHENRRQIVARGMRNRGQKNQHNVARAKIMYDINYCKRRAQWRPKESAINRARGRARRRPNHSTNGVVGGANELTNCCKGGQTDDDAR
jgi:hypothetical protein